MPRTSIYTLCTLLLSAPAFAAVPNNVRFVSDDPLQVVTWLRIDDTFTVKLNQEGKIPKETVLLSNAKCRVAPNGFHCYIKPVKKPGLLTTDVNFVLTGPNLYDISTLVLINGGSTATHLIGHNFIESASGT